MAKFTLDLIDEYPYIVYGLNTTSVDYKLCWNINKALGLALKKVNTLGVFTKQNGTTQHNCFTYTDDQVLQSFHLLENKRGNSLYLPEVKEADFLFIMSEGERERDETIKHLKAIRSVLMAFEINLDKLKHKQNLLLLE